MSLLGVDRRGLETPADIRDWLISRTDSNAVDVKRGDTVTEPTAVTELTDAELDHIVGGVKLEGGQAVADINHNSGPSSASGNESASAGPGYFLDQDTAEAVAKA